MSSALLILEFVSLSPLEHIVLFSIFPLLCELDIERWRIEVVEDSISPTRKSTDRVCHYCISDLLIEIYFPMFFMCILNMNIESRDVLKCLYMVDYIC